MKRATHHFLPTHLEWLKTLKEKTGMSLAEHLRRAIELYAKMEYPEIPIAKYLNHGSRVNIDHRVKDTGCDELV